MTETRSITAADITAGSITITEPYLLLMRGYPASGKTTLARSWVAESPTTRLRINRDDLRMMCHGAHWTPDDPNLTADENGKVRWKREEAVTAAQHAAVRGALAAGLSVVVDDTNLRMANLRKLVAIAEGLDVGWWNADVTTDADECVRRDQARMDQGERGVGEDVIRGMAARYRMPWPAVHLAEGDVVKPYRPDLSLPTAWIVDVDGTVALANGRDFKGYHADAVLADLPNPSVIVLVQALRAAGHQIVVLSGREDRCALQTAAWLANHGIEYDSLLMRRTGDYRKDYIVKDELFEKDVATTWQVLGAIDDRNQVVNLWRSKGITCAQVAEGDF